MRRSPDAAKFRNHDWIELSALTDNCSKLYPARESAIAEKFKLVALDVLNTRIKDFYDIWSLSRGMEFEGAFRECNSGDVCASGYAVAPNKHREVLPKSSAKTRTSSTVELRRPKEGLMLRARRSTR